jgi:hypothetical protein
MENEDQILNDLRAIIRNKPSCLQFVNKLDEIHPWGSSYDALLINLEATDPKNETQTGIIICFAPKYKQKDETKYIIKFPNPDPPSIDSYSIWTKSIVIANIKHHRSLLKTHTIDIDPALHILSPKLTKTPTKSKRNRSNILHSLLHDEVNLQSQKITIQPPITPDKTQLSPPTSPQKRTSPRKTNTILNHQSPQTSNHSIDLFLKTNEIVWFWYPIFQESLNPDTRYRNLTTRPGLTGNRGFETFRFKFFSC